jgi:hypothetical protein
MPGEYPLGDMRPWVMTDHRAESYAPEASCRVGVNEKPDRSDVTIGGL